MASGRRGVALFCLCAVALVAAAIGLAATALEPFAGPARPTARRAQAPAAATGLLVRERRSLAALRGSARPFLRAYLRYEVGRLGRSLTATLRAHCTARFAAELLDRRPRTGAALRDLHEARLLRIEPTFASASGERASLTATARRGGMTERLSFLFVRRRSGWLADGAGE